MCIRDRSTTEGADVYYQFLVNGTLGYYIVEDGEDEAGAALVASDKDALTLYDLDIASDNTAKATKVALADIHDDVEEVTAAVAGAYFTYNDGDDQIVYLADDCIVVDVSKADTAKWGADSIGKEDKVVWVENDDEEATIVFVLENDSADGIVAND